MIFSRITFLVVRTCLRNYASNDQENAFYLSPTAMGFCTARVTGCRDGRPVRNGRSCLQLQTRPYCSAAKECQKLEYFRKVGVFQMGLLLQRILAFAEF